jgi:hypothetical protein
MPTSQSKTPEMDEILKATEAKLEKEKEEEELKRILESNMSGFATSMENTIKEIMEGSHEVRSK